jgi:hypothetical protein
VWFSLQRQHDPEIDPPLAADAYSEA